MKLLNLVRRRSGHMRWKVVGASRNGTLRLSTIVWPGDTLAGPKGVGGMTLRIVTNIVPPFVFEQNAVFGSCFTGVPCLRVRTNLKTQLDDVFADFESGIHVASRPYEVHCCQGLSIKLLDKLSADVGFQYQLYICADGEYGVPSHENSSWTGVVGDLVSGAAHMAVGATSITRSRSTVVDFTVPYFYSGYSIIVSGRKRLIPLNAFMEPFDGWVWVSIVVTATIVAIAVTLLEWNSPFGLNPWGRKRKANYSIGSGLNMVFAILFQHTTKTKSPKAWPSKWLQNFWAGASIFVYSSYTANLAAFLAGRNSGVTVTGMHDPQVYRLTYLVPRLGLGDSILCCRLASVLCFCAATC